MNVSVAVAFFLVAAVAAMGPARAVSPDADNGVFAVPNRTLVEVGGLTDARVSPGSASPHESATPVDTAKSAVVTNQSAGPAPLMRVLQPPSSPVPLPPTPPGSLQMINIR